MTTVVLGWAVPVMLGWGLFVKELLAGVVTVGTAGTTRPPVRLVTFPLLPALAPYAAPSVASLFC